MRGRAAVIGFEFCVGRSTKIALERLPGNCDAIQSGSSGSRMTMGYAKLHELVRARTKKKATGLGFQSAKLVAESARDRSPAIDKPKGHGHKECGQANRPPC